MAIATRLKIGITAMGIGLTVMSLAGLGGDRSRSVHRDLGCRHAAPLTEIAVDRYDPNGVKSHGGTLLRQVSLNATQKIPVIVFPQALDTQTWTKLPSSLMVYLGQGGDARSWRDRWRPDYFYALEVPPQATGLAFGRLCYRNGDVTVQLIDRLEENSRKPAIVVNHKIELTPVSPIPTLRPFQILVNAGSDRRDVLGIQTQVYFTTQSLESKFLKHREIAGYKN